MRGGRFVDIMGVQCHIVERGSKENPLVLLLHGNGCSVATWNTVVDDLAETYYVVAPDLPGNGFTGIPRETQLYGLWFVSNHVYRFTAVLQSQRACS